jgi:hypothetical protein
MTNENTSTRPVLLRKLIKIFIFLIAICIAVPVVAHYSWKYSGSNQWTLELEKNGIKVYSLKAPGSVVKEFKGVTQVNTTLSRIAAVMTSSTTAGCRKFDPGCTAGEILEQWSAKDLSWVQYYRTTFVPPYGPRDFVLKTQISQDSQSKAVTVHVTSLPGLLPPNACCFRVQHVNNTWRYTPLENGKIEVEFHADFDLGTPYYKFNRQTPKNVYFLLSRLEKVFNAEENRKAEFAFIKEP